MKQSAKDARLIRQWNKCRDKRNKRLKYFRDSQEWYEVSFRRTLKYVHYMDGDKATRLLA